MLKKIYGDRLYIKNSFFSYNSLSNVYIYHFNLENTLGNIKIFIAVVAAAVLGYFFLYKNDNPDRPSDEAIVNALTEGTDANFKNNTEFKVNDCKLVEAGFGKATSFTCNVTTSFKDNSTSPKTNDIPFVKANGKWVAAY